MIILWFTLLLVTLSGGQLQSPVAKILKYDFQNTGTGNYYFEYATSDGQARDERGELKDENKEDEHIHVKGSFSYLGPDGVTYTVNYIADDAGFHPEGDHIKVPPFVPWVKGAHSHHHDGKYHPEDHGDDGKYRPEHHRQEDKSVSSSVPRIDKIRTGARQLSPSLPPPSTPAPYPPSSQRPAVPFSTQAFNYPQNPPKYSQGESILSAVQKPVTPFPPLVRPQTTYGPPAPQYDFANAVLGEVSQNKSPYKPSPRPFRPQYNTVKDISTSITTKPPVTYIPSSTTVFPVDFGGSKVSPSTAFPSTSRTPKVDILNKKPSTAYIPSSTGFPEVTVSITPKPTYIPFSTGNPLSRNFRSSPSKIKLDVKENEKPKVLPKRK